MSERIVTRLAARGDGVAEDGSHWAGTAPGDRVLADGTVLPGPHRAVPPCQHFGRCGGCQLQHVDDAALAQFVTRRVLDAATSQGLVPTRVVPAHLSPSRTRRRARLHAQRAGKRILVGFSEGGSHQIVDMAECHVITPILFRLVEPLREALQAVLGKERCDLLLTEVQGGTACDISGLARLDRAGEAALLRLAGEQGLARLAVDAGDGWQTLWEPEPATVRVANIAVRLPPGAFLQATRDGEAALLNAVTAWSEGAGPIADLFGGVGTFAFGLAQRGHRVLCAEGGRDAFAACRTTAVANRLPVEAVHRDLYRNPLSPAELRPFSAVVLDPPRAGARTQVEAIAASAVSRCIYVSCNPSSWARDGRVLADAGFALAAVQAVGQFRWSTHVELVSLFERSPISR